MRRRDFVRWAAATGIAATRNGILGEELAQPIAFEHLPNSLKALVHSVLAREPESFNTDWDGTLAMEGLLRWSRRGLPQGRTFAEDWFDYHVAHDPRLTDEQFYDTYSGPPSRVVRGKVLPFTLYSGFFGLPFPCHALFEQTRDVRARQVCLDVADAILHLAAREQHGLVLHDDTVWSKEGTGSFTIPDTIYFAARALMIASCLEDRIGDVYRKQALHQIRTCADIFLDREKGIARTMLTSAGLGKTYWCRASGWLAHAFAGVLRHLPRDHAAFEEIAADFRRLADGLARFQGPSGGLRVLVNEPETPEETSSTAMCVASIREATAKGWIPDGYSQFLRRGWEFVQRNVQEDGSLRGVYTGWAMSAEQGQMLIDHTRKYRGWIAGVVMHAADEMTS